MRQRLTIYSKSIINFGLLCFCFCCCSTKKSINGHWHEFVKDQFTHCYKVTDSTHSVDDLSIGYKKKLYKINDSIVLWSQSIYEYSTDYKVDKDKIIFNDSITWIRANDDEFVDDLSQGLLIKIIPKEIVGDYDLNYDGLLFRAIIFIGRPKDILTSDNTYKIQLNDVIATVDDIRPFVAWNHQKPDGVILNIDRDVPVDLINSVLCEIYKAGYDKDDVYLTAINKREHTIGLVRVDKTTANKMFIQCRDSLLR